MFLSRSLRRNLLATLLGSLVFLLLYQSTVIDSRSVDDAGDAMRHGGRIQYTATAYCKGETTASGVAVKAGIAAADPILLPQGSVVRIDGGLEQYRGIYTVLDTGPKVKGRHLDLYIWSCHEALAFGRRPVSVTVLRHGWDPQSDPADRGRASD